MQFRVPRFCILACCFMLLPCVAVATADDAEQAPGEKSAFKTRQASLEVAVKHDRGRWLVTVTLRNTGDVPIVVDRDLVMGVTVEVDGPEGARIREESGPVSQQSTREEARKRLTTLVPGQALSRTISLKEGWRVLQGGQGIDSQQRTIAVTGYEEVLRLPKDADPRAIHVKYGRTAHFWDAFLGFTELSARDAGLYLGPLEQTVELVAVP